MNQIERCFRKRVGNDIVLKHNRVGAASVEVENAHAAVCEYHKSDIKDLELLTPLLR